MTTTEIELAAKKLGKKGGETTAKKYGKSHYSEAGKKGALKRWGVKSLEKK